eukprot:UN27939
MSVCPSPDLKTHRASSSSFSNGSELSSKPIWPVPACLEPNSPMPGSSPVTPLFSLSLGLAFLPSLSSMKKRLMSSLWLKKATI